MPGSKNWKILGMGRGEDKAEKAEKHLHELGYKNMKVIGIENDKATDDKIIELLKQGDWDAISFGGGLTGYDDDFIREVTTLHWFNRLVNLVREYAPNAKFIFITGPEDLVDSIERVLGSQEKLPETV